MAYLISLYCFSIIQCMQLNRYQFAVKTLRSSNPTFWWVFGSTFFLLALVLYIPFVRNLFSFSYLHPSYLLVSLLIGIIAFIWLKWAKVINDREY